MGYRQIQTVRLNRNIPALRKNKTVTVLSVTELDSVCMYVSAKIHVCCNLQAFLSHLNDANFLKHGKIFMYATLNVRQEQTHLYCTALSLCSAVLWRPLDFLGQIRLL